MATVPTVIVIEFQAPAQLLSLNDRMHWAKRASLVAQWRKAAWASAVGKGRLGPSLVAVELPVFGNRRRDPHNFVPTIKPIIDGLVDARLWPDDTPEWVATLEPMLVVGARNCRVRLTPR